jgi:hypothetical protein
MVTPKPLLQLALDVPETATCGNTAKIRATLTTTDNTPVNAMIPLKVSIEDANGVAAEGSGYYAAEKGVLEISLDLAPNEDPGVWQVRVRDLASGMESVQWMKVAGK